MLNHTIKALLPVLGMALLLGPTANAAKPGKIAVCHAPTGNSESTKLIEVGVKGNAVDAHLAHGDWLATAAVCADDIDDNDCDGSADDADAENYDCVVQTGNADATCADRVCIEPPPPVSCPCWSAEDLENLMTGAADGNWYCYLLPDGTNPSTGEIDGYAMEDCDVVPLPGGGNGCVFHSASARNQHDRDGTNRQQCYYQEPDTGPSGGIGTPRIFSVANGTLTEEQAALCLAEVKAGCATLD